MNGLREIKQMNIPQTKRESEYRVQRDRLAQVLRKVLALPRGACDTPEHTNARKVLVEIYGE